MYDEHSLLFSSFSSASLAPVCVGSKHDDRAKKRHGWVSVPNAEDHRLVSTGENETNMKKFLVVAEM